MLGPAADREPGQALGVQSGAELLDDLLDIPLPVQAALVQLLRDLAIGIGLQIAAGQIFQFPFELPDSQAIGQGRIEFTHIRGHLAAPGFILIERLVGKLAQGLGTFRQLDEYHPDIVGHGQQHLAQGLALPPLGIDLGEQVVHAGELGRAFHQGREMGAEAGQQGVPLDVFFR